jgi:hypothetical protein
VLTLIAGFMVFAALVQPADVRADTGRVLTGELVVLNGSNTQFRIVGYNGTFTAPAGTPLHQLDGHPVQVDLASSGKVLAIHDTPIPINPIEHGAVTVRGEMVVVDAVARRFSVAGDTQTYSAPPSMDIAAYAGKLVEFKVDETGRVTELHLVGTPPYGYAPPYPAAPAAGTRYDTNNTYGSTAGYSAPAAPSTSCTYAGQPYSAGSAICQAGSQYRCNLGQWQNLGSACTADAKSVNLPPSEPRACIVGGATVANGSGICRDGSTLRCEDGTWINTQIACR